MKRLTNSQLDILRAAMAWYVVTGGYPRGMDIARVLGCPRPSLSLRISEIRAMGLITKGNAVTPAGLAAVRGETRMVPLATVLAVLGDSDAARIMADTFAGMLDTRDARTREKNPRALKTTNERRAAAQTEANQ